MRLFLLPAILLCALPADSVAARASSGTHRGDIALGLILGSPTGVSMKYWSGPGRAFDAALGIPFDPDVRFDIHADHLWQFPIRANVPGEFPFYFGLGGRLRSVDKPRNGREIDFGIRVPLGLEFSPGNVPLNFFAEVAPVAVFAGRGKLDLDGGVGLRYRF